MAKWSRQTYEMVANGIQSELDLAPRGITEDAEAAIRRIAVYFAGQFTADNHTFSRERFMEACGFGSNGS